MAYCGYCGREQAHDSATCAWCGRQASAPPEAVPASPPWATPATYGTAPPPPHQTPPHPTPPYQPPPYETSATSAPYEPAASSWTPPATATATATAPSAPGWQSPPPNWPAQSAPLAPAPPPPARLGAAWAPPADGWYGTPPGWQPPPQPWPAAPAQQQASGLSTAGIICGAIAFLFLPFLFGPAGLILGSMAKRRGQPRAQTAILVSAIGMCLGFVFGVMFAMSRMHSG